VNNQAPELSPEARRLINEARGADDPTAEDHARVKARWLASVAAVAGVSSLTEAARAAGGIGWGFKAAGAALVIAAGAIGLNFALDTGGSADAKRVNQTESQRVPPAGWSGSSPERFQKTPRARPESENAQRGALADPAPAVAIGDAPKPLALLPEVAEGSQPSPDVETTEAVAPRTAVPQPAVAQPGMLPTAVPPAAIPSAAAAPTAARAKPVPRAIVARSSVPKAAGNEAAASTVSAPVAAAPGPSGQLGEELALLSDVRSSIQEGTAVRALELLNRYESRFGQPILGMEADALRVDALCKAGQREAARESARAFQNEWPGSPLERRVSAACP
jgi:hypothetical protein